MKTCPHCDGAGHTFGFWDGTDESGRRVGGAGKLPCMLCGETGQVSLDQWSRIQAGKRLRDERVARGISLREQAQALGITMLELSNRERGR